MTLKLSDIEKISLEVVKHILHNWKRFAYIDNTSCGKLNLRRLINHMAVKMGFKTVNIIQYIAIKDTVLQYLKDHGFNIIEVKRKHRNIIYVCRGTHQ